MAISHSLLFPKGVALCSHSTQVICKRLVIIEDDDSGGTSTRTQSM